MIDRFSKILGNLVLRKKISREISPRIPRCGIWDPRKIRFRTYKNQRINGNLKNQFKTHYYQPLWTLVGGGQVSLESTGKPTHSVMPKTIHHIKDKVSEFQPKENAVTLKSGKTLEYDALVISPGLELNYCGIPGKIQE